MSHIGDIADNINLPRLTSKQPKQWVPFTFTIEGAFTPTTVTDNKVETIGVPRTGITQIRLKRVFFHGLYLTATSIPEPKANWDMRVTVSGFNPSKVVMPLFIDSSISLRDYRYFYNNENSIDCDFLFDIVNTGSTQNIQFIFQILSSASYINYSAQYNLTCECEYCL